MLILKIPYAVPIGILIGVTALIPVVGAFIGIIIGAVLIVSVNPIKVITFVVFVLILQQFEGKRTDHPAGHHRQPLCYRQRPEL